MGAGRDRTCNPWDEESDHRGSDDAGAAVAWPEVDGVARDELLTWPKRPRRFAFCGL